MIWLVHALLIHKSEFFASQCLCTGNQQDCKHRNNSQQLQMFKAGSHILEKVKRVSGRRVIRRTEADIEVHRGEGSPDLPPGHCFLPAVKPLHSSLQSSVVMRKQSEHKLSTVEQGHFRPRTIPTYLAESVIKGGCPGVSKSGRLSHLEPEPHSAKMSECLKGSLCPVLWGLAWR